MGIDYARTGRLVEGAVTEVLDAPIFELDSVFSVGAMLGHVSYVMIIVAMLMDRLLYLRLLAIGSGLTGLLYSTFWLFDPVSIWWETLFILAIAYQLIITAYHNRISRFEPDEAYFRHIAAPRLSPAYARRLLLVGRIGEAPKGTILTKEGEVVSELIFILSGEVEVLSQQTAVARCKKGDFIGEVSVTNKGTATATVVALSPIRYFAFEGDAFRRLIAKQPVIAQEMELAFRTSLREKLVSTNEAVAAAQ